MTQLPRYRLVDIVAMHFNDIAAHFPASAKITIAIRVPGRPDEDVVMTDDTIVDVATTLYRHNRRIDPPLSPDLIAALEAAAAKAAHDV